MLEGIKLQFSDFRTYAIESIPVTNRVPAELAGLRVRYRVLKL